MSACLSACPSVFANSRSQFLLDRLGKCLQLFVSSDSISCNEFASQFGLAFFVYAKNIQNDSEYRVDHASGQLNRTSDAGNCGHGSSPPTSRNGNELSGDNILWPRLIASGPSERRQHERRQLRSKRRQREFIPSRLENVVKEFVRSL